MVETRSTPIVLCKVQLNGSKVAMVLQLCTQNVTELAPTLIPTITNFTAHPKNCKP